jgi:acyl-CoA thioester hydrolase
MKIFQREITVRKQDIDDLNHVNNVVYLQWVQDVASAHWQLLASPELMKRYSWVVLKHEIEYFSQAFLHNQIQVTTWVAWSEGFRSERHVEFHLVTEKKLLVRAKTTWCLLDAMTMRPRKIDTEINALFHD